MATGKKQGVKLKMSIKLGGWVNCDAAYLACLLRGTFGGWGARAPAWRRARAVAVGVDYASRSFATVAADGSFAMMVLAFSRVLHATLFPAIVFPTSMLQCRVTMLS